MRRLPFAVAVVSCPTKVCGSGPPGPQELRDPANPSSATGFGNVVAMSGDTAMVGAPIGTGYGTASVYVRRDQAWVEEATLSASDQELGDTFAMFRSFKSGDHGRFRARDHFR